MGSFIGLFLLALGPQLDARDAGPPRWASGAVSISFAPDPLTGRTAEDMESVKENLRERLRAIPAGLEVDEGGEEPSVEPPPERP
jgi:hypothetical protein